jgi:hypothetical protein
MVIGIVIAIALIATWRIFAGRVDKTKPDAVATAFFKALKGNDVEAAAKYWVPDGAAAWSAGAAKTLDQMQGGTSTRFFEDLPSGTPVFVSSRRPKSPANEQTLTTGGSSVDLRQIEGKWYVCKAPI